MNLLEAFRGHQDIHALGKSPVAVEEEGDPACDGVRNR
jgi:hypothetical protein